MEPYEDIIMKMLVGDTPKAKHDKLVRIAQVLQQISFPRRGTEEDSKTLQDFADEIIKDKLVINY